MGNFTSVTAVATIPAPAGGDGVKTVIGTMVGPASYDAGGSEVDFSAIFKSKVYSAVAYVDDAGVRCIFVPATSYATATPLCFVDDNAGTELTGNLATTMAVTHWVAKGTDA
jgi:hypothetical protein